jgi:tetratricopeptide (TPR) repeat protein/cephalosporin hydroxylase
MLMQDITLSGKKYRVKQNEFIIKPHMEYNNLIIYPKVGELERIIGLLNDLTEGINNSSLLIYGWNYGGFVAQGCSKVYNSVFVNTKEVIQDTSLPSNILINSSEQNNSNNIFAIYIDTFTDDLTINPNILYNSYILCNDNININTTSHTQIKLYDTNLVLHVPNVYLDDFNNKFYYYFDEYKNFKYDNLIHLCIMVKNAGPLFEKVLTDNLPIIDRWTILDTGSTDGTQDIIKKVLKNKKGQLFEEPFINFRESRNRCLDLAGKHCKYLLMLDDTYVIKNNLREFLNLIRGDQFGTSYSLLIRSDDTEYYSNRITMSEKGLRYIYRIHEVIQFEDNKTTIVIPKNAAYIEDYRADYMEKRTMDRKRYDLQLLYETIEEDPTNPRHYYYLAQTHLILEEYEKAIYWFNRRATTDLKGHEQERFDSWFEMARIFNFKLNRPWEECKRIYEEAMKVDSARPEPLYFIGIHYYLNGDKKEAFKYFKEAFAFGYPINSQFSLKPTLVFHFLPKFLTELCYEFKDYILGQEAAARFINNNKADADMYSVIVSYYNICRLMNSLPTPKNLMPIVHNKPIIAFVVDGGWSPWTGRDILDKGVGGSETYIIEIARWIQAHNTYNCYVFCKCSKSEIFEGVYYKSLDEYPEFLVNNIIHTVIVSRYSEYIPMSLHNNVENAYLVLHDLGPSGLIIPVVPKLKKVLCLTDWHTKYFVKNFSLLEDRTESFYYGIDTNLFKPSIKVKNSFIYSSFPNRGLLPLLQMWPKIKSAIPNASLQVFSDINGKWVNEVAGEQMNQIRNIINSGVLRDVEIVGWVSKKELAEAWSKAEFWVYPCIFEETFCLTALEAAATKTFAISTPLAALQETVGERGILIPGNPLDNEWQEKVVYEIVNIMSNNTKREELINKNYEWAMSHSWKSRGEEFVKKYINYENINSLNMGEMYNWTNDLPRGNRILFEEALAKVNPTNILEIGTFAGTSLIEMLRLYPNAKGTAIDMWTNYDEDNISILKYIQENNIENIFDSNVISARMVDRITKIKGDSKNVLCRLLSEKKQYDFIYVDGSHKCLDCFADMVLSWELLVSGGILAVDDVLYNYHKVEQGQLLEYPLMAKKHFMEVYKGQYRVISDSYRLFIQKL